MSFQCISVHQAKELISQGEVILLDIRDPDAYNAGHIDGAILVNNDNAQAIISAADKSKPVIIYCYHGNSSKSAADYFFSAGFSQSYSVDGGYEVWQHDL